MNLEEYRLYRLLTQLRAFKSPNVIRNEFTEQFIIDVQNKYNLNLEHYLKTNLFKSKANLDTIDTILASIRIECNVPSIVISDQKMALFYDFIGALNAALKSKKFTTEWYKEWDTLFPTNVQFIIDMYRPLFGTNALVLDVDVECLTELQMAMTTIDNPALSLFETHSRPYMRNFPSPSSPSDVSPTFETGEYYYVNELAKIRFDADLYVCHKLREELNTFIQTKSNTDPDFGTRMTNAKAEFKEWYKSLDPRDVPDVVQLFPDEIGLKLRLHDKEYAFQKLKYYLVYMNAINILSDDDWNEIRQNQYHTLNNRLRAALVLLRAQYPEGIDREEADAYLFSLDFKEKTTNYGISIVQFMRLYKCRLYLEYVVDRIVNYTVVYRTSIGKYFTDEYLFKLYMEYFKTNIDPALKALKTIQRRNRRQNMLRTMAWRIFQQIRNPNITPNEIKKIVLQTVDAPSMVNRIVTQIMQWLAEQIPHVPIVGCSICAHPATGQCCGGKVAYCSEQCQRTDWPAHKINHE